ncbi:uncharacterized protein EDB93DRAFT_1102436 [Suillus bovinus]|uniref:uncharacterized protein n=1 Tax=Suillus bovinus TaxID=48563 RepID=UPI001B8750AE|nr:uncharacterized protein EDB93DRAFT_1102436 [Suillus bovinus]KAG2154305.1 hypothetical protein EDB93DRAFT_1102436 [Suillus bovinus]
MSTQYCEHQHANEEIRWLNVKVGRLLTKMQDDAIDYPRTITQLQSNDPPLAAELWRRWTQLRSINACHIWHMPQIMQLPGYSGPKSPGTHDRKDGDGDDTELGQQLEDVQAYIEGLDHHRVDLELAEYNSDSMLISSEDLQCRFVVYKSVLDRHNIKSFYCCNLLQLVALKSARFYFLALNIFWIRLSLELSTLIFDRLTGGSTIVLHHPGATPPALDISPENLKAEIYINPKVLSEHCELHSVVAQISQLFIADYVTPLAQAFTENRIHNNWKGSSPVSQTPSKGKTTSKGKQVEIVPLIPSPVLPSLAHFTFYGCPRGSLEGLMTSNSNILSYMPSYDSRIMWKPTQIRLSHTQESKGYQVRKEGLSGRAVILAQDHSACQPVTPAICNQSSSSQAERRHPPSNSDDKCYPPSTSDQAWRHYPPTTPTRSKSTSFELPTPTLITASMLVLAPFGNETEVVLEELGYPDHFHWVCISISKDYLLKQWFLKLQEVAEISEEHVEAIANAMLTDSQPVTSFPVRITVMVLPGTARSHNPRWLVPQTYTPYVKVLKEVCQQLTERQQAKCLDEDQEVQAILNYINAKATDLVSKFKQPRCCYLERLSLGSVVHHCKCNKTSAWHAYMHFKGIQNNATILDKSFSEKSNIANLAKMRQCISR